MKLFNKNGEAAKQTQASIDVPHPFRDTTISKDWRKLVWVFALMSIAGLVGETLQHFFAFNEWESRPGLIWGPFSPIYGTAAVILTLVLEPLTKKNILFVFVVAAVTGGVLEYFAAWAMETFWGVVAWSYEDVPFNINGKTCLFICVVWGILGALWVRYGIALFNKLFEKLDLHKRSNEIFTDILALYLVVNIVVTATVLLRADARTHDVPPQNVIEMFYDQVYPDEVLQDRFENMGGLGA